MKRYIRALSIVALPAIIAACNDFLTCSECQTDPNRQTSATLAQRLTGIEAAMGLQWNSHLARSLSMFIQQTAGTDRQYGDIGVYNIGEETWDNEFSGVYTAGGLIDIKQLKADADAANEPIYGGIARVIEAMDIGMAASIWGPIPYSEAAGDVTKPKLDNQQDVYAAVQSLLDEAIAMLGQSGNSPGDADVWLGGDRTAWTQVAHTLKGRFYMHWAEAQVSPSASGAEQTAAQTACGGNCVDKAISEFAAGISSSGNDLRTWNSATPGEENWWWRFVTLDRANYLSPGASLVDTMVSRSDPRLSSYFTRSGGVYRGAKPGEAYTAALSKFGPRVSADFRQPMVTHNENLLHWAEALYYKGDGQALTKLNEYKTANGLPTVSLSGPALLQEIAIEEYIAQFQNVDAYNDWKRTCYPNITPAVSGQDVPARLFYGLSERNANSENIVPPDQQPHRNLNDPIGGTAHPTDCLGSTRP